MSLSVSSISKIGFIYCIVPVTLQIYLISALNLVIFTRYTIKPTIENGSPESISYNFKFHNSEATPKIIEDWFIKRRNQMTEDDVHEIYFLCHNNLKILRFLGT